MKTGTPVSSQDSSLPSAKVSVVSKVRELLDAILYDTIWVEGDFSRDICKHCGVDRPLNPLALSGASGHREDCIYRLALDAEEETL